MRQEPAERAVLVVGTPQCWETPEPHTTAVGLRLRTWREHMVLRPDSPAHALRAKCARTSPTTAALERYPCVPAGPLSRDGWTPPAWVLRGWPAGRRRRGGRGLPLRHALGMA